MQYHLFHKFVMETQATQENLLLHHNVHWFSKNKALEHFFESRDQLEDFLKQSQLKAATDHLHVMQDRIYAQFFFSADIFSHLSTLNLQLQGKEKSVVAMVEKLDAFGENP